MTATPTACQNCNEDGLHCTCAFFNPKPRQPDTSARDSEAQSYAFMGRFRENAQNAYLHPWVAARHGFECGHAQATAQIGDRLAELHRRIDRYIKENCALYEQLAASENRADAYEKTLEIYARPDEAFPWRGVIARETLAAHKRGEGEK